MKYKRTLRISEEIKKIVSNLVMNELKDPGIPPFTTITRVDTTGDLRFSNIYFSILGEGDSEEIFKALNRAKGFIRRKIGEELNMRYTPEPMFKFDSSIEYSRHISDIIDNIEYSQEDGTDSDIE